MFSRYKILRKSDKSRSKISMTGIVKKQFAVSEQKISRSFELLLNLIHR